MPGAAYQVQVGAEEGSGFVSSEDVFDTGSGQEYSATSGSRLR